jgi:two-component system, OmpR family, response regulator
MRILVVDDDPLTLSFIGMRLREQGYAVDTSEDGEDGLFKAESWDYDAIVLDGMLPRIDGWEFLSRLRKTKKTPVLMLTARKATLDKVSGLDAGADDYLVKPVDPPELLARLRALIRRTTEQARPRLVIGSVEIDQVARVVTQRGAPVALSPREYAIVEHLATHPGSIVTRSELYEHVFDENDDTLSNVIDVHVGRIRRKLGRKFIVTHHGHGYSVQG